MGVLSDGEARHQATQSGVDAQILDVERTQDRANAFARGEAMWRAIEGTASSFKVRLTAADVQGSVEIERALEAFAREPNGGLIVLPGPIPIVHRDVIAASAVRHRLPAVYGFRFFVTDGGLVSYGIDPAEQSRQAAGYVDRILKGEKPGDLPVQQPTKYELVINLKTARALGLRVPDSALARADEVIE